MIFLHFIYGLAFFSLGLIVGLETFRPISADIKPAFRNLAAYGLLGASHHWFELWTWSTNNHFYAWQAVAFDVGTMTLSLLFLAAFGVRLITDRRTYIYALPFLLLVLWAGVAFFGPVADGVELHERLIILDLVLILVPANLITAWGFVRGRPLVGKADDQVRSDKLVLAALFMLGAVWSSIAGITGVFATTAFLVVRSLTAVAVTFFIIRVLRVFEGVFIRDRLRVEAIEYDAKLAADIQMELVPAQALIAPGVEVRSLMLPARFVAGDIYDYQWVENKLRFMIADMSGKGAPAAILSTAALISIDRAAKTWDRPDRLLQATNEFLERRFPENTFMTMIIGEYSSDSGRLELASAAHFAPFIFREVERKWRQVELSGSLPLGIFRQIQPATKTLEVKHGDRLLLYTDGLIDAKLADGSRLGFLRVEAWLNKRADLSADRLLGDLKDFVVNATAEQLADDVAVVLINIR